MDCGPREFSSRAGHFSDRNETNALASFTNLAPVFPAHEMAALAQLSGGVDLLQAGGFRLRGKEFPGKDSSVEHELFLPGLDDWLPAAFARQGYSDAEKYFGLW